MADTVFADPVSETPREVSNGVGADGVRVKLPVSVNGLSPRSNGGK